jgi:trk system potassium uptake protein TrkA
MKQPLYIVIVGCGRLGSGLAQRCNDAGHSVVVIDRSAEALAVLTRASFGGFVVEGDAAEPSTLRRAGIERADLLVAATQNDNVNLLVAQVARSHFGVARVVARVFDPRRQAIYRQLQLDTVCPTSLAAEALLAHVTAAAAAGNEGGAA